jgi:localization factor PodJL
MARAYPTQPQEYGQEHGSEWQALRGELVDLLDQVESQVARSRQQDPNLQGIAERMRDLRFQVAETEPDMRHREALKQVKRAVDRFSERDEGYGQSASYGAGSGYGGAPTYSQRQETYPPNPRDMLQSAIQQIRARQAEIGGGAPRPAPAPMPQQQMAMPPQQRAMEAVRFDELAHAVTSVSGRLERLEVELKSQGRSQTGNVKEIAEQVAQLSHVVELLAGAVGETGQVKRLEGQIAGLAKLVAQGPSIDLSALTRRLDDLATSVGRMNEKTETQAGSHRQETAAINQRLDDVTATMGRLADLQVQFANRVDSAAQASAGLRERVGSLDSGLKEQMGAIEAGIKAHMGSMDSGLGERLGSIDAGIKSGMDAVESGVRNIYDRIDAIEKHTALEPGDVDRLTAEMARFTEALKNPVQPQGLIELVDELNRRIASIESSHQEVGGLKADAEALRQAVIAAVEPRFAALEMQIEALSDRVADRPQDISVSQLEAQVRQLVARMDQTGEQLTGLARLYSQPVEREPAPDFEALADMVAARAGEAMAQHAPTPMAMPAPMGFSDGDIDEIERRVSRLIEAQQREKPSDDLIGIESSVREVSERLARLESSLAARAVEAERIERMPVEPIMPEVAPRAAPMREMPELSHDPIAPLLAEAEAAALNEAQSEQSSVSYYAPTPPPVDAMPASPDEDAPLVDRPFGNGNSLEAALEAKNGPRKRHPGLSYEPLPGQGEPGPAPSSQPLNMRPAAAQQRPAFDPNAVERPPRPVSSFDEPERASFAEPAPAPVMSAVPPAPEPQTPEQAPSANTFIAAARRAAQRQQAGGGNTASAGSGSLIARAFASFQSAAKPGEAKPVEAPAPKAEKPAKVAKPKKEKKPRALAGDKPARTEWTPDEAAAVEPKLVTPSVEPLPPPPMATVKGREPLALDQEATTAVDATEAKESFLTRHRRPILLAAAIVAISFLTLNLVMQRLGQPAAPTPEPAPATTAPVNTSALDTEKASELATKPLAQVAAVMPRIIPMTDTLATASIDPGAARGFTPSDTIPAMPAAFAATAQEGAAPAAMEAIDDVDVASIEPLAATVTPLADDVAPPAMESPVQVEMPPEALGPEPLRAAAAAGDARAQFEIAAIYTEGRAVPEDDAAAAVWYERAAAQGFAPAQYRLGNLYENGRGVTKDLTQAKLWYQRAAETGNRMAMHNLAALYAGGELGKQEFDSAAEWFQQAAERGMRDSQFNLGMLYARGLGVTQSFEESYRWFGLAALRGDADAAKARDDIARSLDAETVSRLDDEIGAYKPASIDLVANFAPIGTWSPSFDPGPTITETKVVKNVQAALTLLGYDVGTPDGLAGPRTAEAIKSFERATGMSESGAVNPRLLAVLGSQPV